MGYSITICVTDEEFIKAVNKGLEEKTLIFEDGKIRVVTPEEMIDWTVPILGEDFKLGADGFKKYRKKPVVIKAWQNKGESFDIKTLEGTMRCAHLDWVIEGIKDEMYPCKPDVFKKTYEKVEDRGNTMDV